MQQADYNVVSRLLGDLGNLDCTASELAALLAALVEHSPVPLWIFGPDHLIVYNNRSSCRFGTGNNVVGSHVNSFSAHIRALLLEGLATCDATGMVCAKAGWIVSPIIGERYLHFDFLPLPGGMVACLSHDRTESERTKASLSASEQRVRNLAIILERTPIPFGTATAEGRILMANQAFCDLTGYSEEELRDLNMFDALTTGTSRQVEADALSALRSSGVPQRYEKDIVRHDNGIVPVEVFIQNISDADGNLQHITFFAIDISQRRQAASALRDNEERFHYVADLATDGIWDWRIGSDEEYLSPRFKEMLGYSDDELPNRADTWERLIHPDDHALAKQAFRDHLTLKTPFVFTARYLHKNGKLVWVSCRGQAIADQSGEPYRVVGTHTDVTERKAAEASLAEAYEFNQKIISSSFVGIFVNNASGECVLVNAAAAEIIGAAQDALLGLNIHKFESWRSSGLLSAAEKAQSTGSTQSGEFCFTAAPGKAAYWECYLTPFYSNGEMHLLTIVIDISDRKHAEERLRESEQRLALALDGAADGIWDHDLRSMTTYRSTHVTDRLGYGPDGLGPNPESWINLVHPDDLPAVLAAWQAHVDGQTEQYRSEHRLRTAAGDYIWVLDSGKVAERDLQGRPTRVVGTHKDITEAKHSEQALRNSEEKYRELVEMTREGVWAIDAQLITTFANQSLADILGFTREEMLGRHLLEFVFAEDVEPYKERMRARALGKAQTYEQRLKRKDGAAVWCLISGTPRMSETGQFIGSFAMLTNITERKHAEAALRQSESRMRSLLSSMSDLVFVMDRDLVFLEYHQPASQELFITPEMFLGKRFDDVGFSEPAFSAIKHALLQTLEHGGTGSARYYLDLQKGRAWFDLRVSSLQGTAATASGLICVVRDITAQYFVEEALRENEERLRGYSKQLRALMARLETVQERERTRIAREVHDVLGQNLTSIKMDLRWMEHALAKNSASPQAKLKLLNRAAGAVELTDSTMSTVQKLCAELRPSVLDKLGLGPALQFEARMMEERTGIRCQVDIPPVLPPTSAETVTTCFRICQECLTNVVRHSQATSVHIVLSAEGPVLALTIRDNGVGIDDAALNDPHSLGLLGIKERVALLNGQVNIHSARNGGTLVEIRVPLETQEQHNG